MTLVSLPFRFDKIRHEYIDLATGALFPHITQMLEQTGWINDLWYTEHSCRRGTEVHRLTTDFDLGALNYLDYNGTYTGFLSGYVKARSILRPTFLGVEEPLVHPYYRYGGRPDRVVVINGLRGVLEIKTAKPDPAHQIQTALQAILVAVDTGLLPEMLARFCVYLKGHGKFVCEQHKQLQDFRRAADVIRKCCGS